MEHSSILWERQGKDTSDFDNSVVSMFGYIEDNTEKMVSAKDVIK